MLRRRRSRSDVDQPLMQTVVWSSIDPRNTHTPGELIPYSDTDNAAIEMSFQKKGSSGKHKLTIMGHKFFICFSSMRQYNEIGGSRPVFRTVLDTTVDDKVRAVLNKSSPYLTKSAVSQALAEIEKMDQCTEMITKNIATYKHRYGPTRTAPSIMTAFKAAKVNIDPVVSIMTLIIDLFCIGEVGGQGIHESYDMPSAPPVGNTVNRYFANVSDGQIRMRKYLSLLGIRNLLVYGQSIFSELHYQLYSDDRSKYGHDEGVYKMLHYTGNTVDLDTKVLDCNVQLKQLNEQFKNKFRDAIALFNSQEAANMVYTSGKYLIHTFIDTMKLDDVTIEKRALCLPKACPKRCEVAVETHSSNRGRWPMWGYMNVGVLTFHVNVPNLVDVMGAVLKAPFHLVKAFILVAQREGVFPRETTDNVMNTNVDFNVQSFILAMKDFFSDGGAVSDSCFNGKWRAVEAYLDKIVMSDTIHQALYRLQTDNQDIFTKELFDMDDEMRSKETSAMIKLVRRKGLQARDPATNTVRVISKSDVEGWIEATK